MLKCGALRNLNGFRLPAPTNRARFRASAAIAAITFRQLPIHTMAVP
jgi:hypothetical protein